MRVGNGRAQIAVSQLYTSLGGWGGFLHCGLTVFKSHDTLFLLSATSKQLY